MSRVSLPPPLTMATHVALRGQRQAEAAAAEAAGRLVAASGPSIQETGRALVEAVQAAPNVLRSLSDLHQARVAYAATASGEVPLRGADARSAALIRWSL